MADARAVSSTSPASTSVWKLYFSRRMAVTLVLGFASGIPLALTGGTLQAWMASEKVDLTVIGFFSLVGLPYTIKYVFAPILDRFTMPFLGRRQGWMLTMQALLFFGISAMAFSNPVESPGVVAFLALLVALFSANQDIVIDAYRAELLPPEELGAGAGLYVMGYRIAMLVSGALALILSDQMSWKAVYLLMACTMAIGMAATLLAPKPAGEPKIPKSLAEAVVQPFLTYFQRKGAMEMLLFIILFKMGDVMAGAMTTPFMIQIGFTKTDIGTVNKGLGMIATIAGSLFGGAALARWGINRSLWVFGILQAASNLVFMMLAQAGHSYPMLFAAIGVENFCGGMGTSGFVAFMMSLCDKRFTATQYALLSSIMAITRTIAGVPTGWLAKNVGWETYFLITAIAAIPGLLLLSRFSGWASTRNENGQEDPSPTPAA